MNYYKRHLGDYAKDTGHLSALEHGVFTLLLDHYYATEKPIHDSLCERIAKAYADHEREACKNVLLWFFSRQGDLWINAKAEEVIADAADKSLKAKDSASMRWHKNRNANASNPHSERNASHKPLATSHKEAKATSLVQQAARFDEFWAEYPVKKGKDEAMRKWKARSLDLIADEIITDVKARKLRDRQWLDGYAPHGSTYVNGRLWQDEIEAGKAKASGLTAADEAMAVAL